MSIIITDVVFNPEGLDIEGEYVVIRNEGTTSVDMSRWRLHDTLVHRGAPYTFTFPRFTLAPSATVRVHTGSGTNDQDDLYWGRSWAVWNNTGDTAVLLDALGGEVSRFSYQIPRPKSEEFPKGFFWGAATAGYQVEGSAGGQDWDKFVASPKIVARVNSNSQKVGLDVRIIPPGMAIAHRSLPILRRDLDRAALLGINAYRFSIEWGRLQTTPSANETLTDSDINQNELQYYNDVIDEILSRGMIPLVTLNHLTLPEWVLTPPEATSILGETMEDDAFRASLRGWESSETVKRFVRYVEYVVSKFKDRVDYWITLNEPVGSMVGVGYIGGMWPPGFTLDGTRAKQAYFNLLRAHVLAFDTIKRVDDVDADHDGKSSLVGFAHAMLLARNHPANAGRNQDLQFDYFMNWHILDALIKGEVDTSITWRKRDRNVLTNDAASNFFGIPVGQWKRRADFIGLNYYRSVAIYYDFILSLRADFMGGAFDQNMNKSTAPHGLVNELGWEMSPHGMSHFVSEIHNRYRIPIIVTENGLPESGDRNRAPHLIAHLRELFDAINGGATVKGYIYWSLLDNFEWHEHYRPQARFGLFSVDRLVSRISADIMPRHITEGAIAYGQIIHQNGLANIADRFGTINSSGSSMIGPKTSAGVMYEANILPRNVGPVSVYFTQLASSEFYGLMYYLFKERWVRLQNITWDGREKLMFSHNSWGDIPKRSFDVTCTLGKMSGTFEEQGVKYPFDLFKTELAGVWWLLGLNLMIDFVRLEPDMQWQIKILSKKSSKWEELPTIFCDGKSFTAGTPAFTVEGILQANVITGKIKIPSLMELTFTGDRAVSSLPF